MTADDGGRVLAVDLGDARIGLALSDELRLTASPLEPLAARGIRKDLQAVRALIEEHQVGTVVVGLPLLMSGEDGERATAARQWAGRLSKQLPGVAVELWDERLTTVEAERTMIQGNVRRDRRKQKIDGLAAVLILQSYLEARQT